MQLLAFDTETHLITDTDSAPKPVCCTWYDGSRASITYPGSIDTQAIFADPSNLYIGQSVAYDMVLMMRWHPELIPDIIRALDEGRVFDTQMRERMVHLSTIGGKGYPMFPSLADMTLKYLKIDISADKKGDDIWRLKYGTLDGIPFEQWPSEALRYAMDDAVHTYNVFQAQGGLHNIQPTEQLQVQAAVVLQAIGVWGFSVDQNIKNTIGGKLEAKAKVLHEQIDKFGWTGKGSQERLQALVRSAWQYRALRFMTDRATLTGVMIKPDEWTAWLGERDAKKALGDAYKAGTPPGGLYVAQGVDWASWCKDTAASLPAPPMTTRGYSTAGETLEQLADIVPQFQVYMDLKHYEKMLENYIYPYKYETAHPRFVPMVGTGRTGCRGAGSSSNMQNIPRRDKDRPDEAFRTMFKARKGRVLGTTDYSQLELCTLAATIREFYPGYPCALGDAIDDGRDVHCVTGGLFVGLSYEQMIEGKKRKDEKILQIRQSSKAVNFGKPGGLGVPAMVAYAKANYGVIMSIDEMRKLDNAWARAWPEIPNKYLRTNKDLVAASPTDGFTARTITGREKADCLFTEGSNFSFQGLAADGAKAAMWRLWSEMMLGWYWSRHAGQGYGHQFRESPLRESRIVNFVHDEIVGEHPEGDLGKAALARQDAIMVAEMTTTCHNKIKISVESKLSDAWEH